MDDVLTENEENKNLGATEVSSLMNFSPHSREVVTYCERGNT